MLYNTFISYNSKNVDEAQYLYEVLSGSSLSVFLDRIALKPGDLWQKEIEKAIIHSQSIIILIGGNGIGPWQEYEDYIFQLMTKPEEPTKKIIPVLLENAEIPKDETIPAFIHGYQAIKFTSNLENEKDKLLKLSQVIPRSIENQVGGYERPLLKKEEDLLVTNTISWYNQNAELFRDKWKYNIPIGPLEMFMSKLKSTNNHNSLKVLDVGCGPGHHSHYLAQQDIEVTGLDLAKGNIDIAARP